MVGEPGHRAIDVLAQPGVGLGRKRGKFPGGLLPTARDADFRAA
jgi:hypothetical protein